MGCQATHCIKLIEFVGQYKPFEKSMVSVAKTAPLVRIHSSDAERYGTVIVVQGVGTLKERRAGAESVRNDLVH